MIAMPGDEGVSHFASLTKDAALLGHPDQFALQLPDLASLPVSPDATFVNYCFHAHSECVLPQSRCETSAT